MADLNAAKVIRRVRLRLELSQEALSRVLNATKGAVQHWERGRNNPDLARLLALRQVCPPGPERKELEALIRQTQAQVAPLPSSKGTQAAGGAGGGPRGYHPPPPHPAGEGLALLRRENTRLQRQVTRLQATLLRRSEQLRILEDLATDLQREKAELRATLSGKGKASSGPAASPLD